MTGQATRLGWKRTLMAGSCFALAFGAFGCAGQVSGLTRLVVGGPSGTGAGSPGPGGTGTPGLGGGGGPGQPTSVTLDSGRSVMRRLNQTEYNNTVHDLLG